MYLSIDVEESEKIDNKTGKQTGHVVRFGAIIYSDLVHSLAGQEFSCDCYDARWMWIVDRYSMLLLTRRHLEVLPVQFYLGPWLPDH